MKKILFLIVELSFFTIIYFYDLPCIFKSVFNLACPMCGITRTLKSIFALELENIFEYNLLALPIIIFIIIINIYLIYDIIHNTNKLYGLFGKYYKEIIFVLFINFILNNTVI